MIPSRVQWRAHSWNETSIRTAMNIGFSHEATLQYAGSVPANKIGFEIPGSLLKARHEWVGSVTLDDWSRWVKEKVADRLKV